MDIVILHCHFERGGVTQVVENHVRALKDTAAVQRILLVSGQRTTGLSADTLAAATVIELADFDYDSQPVGADLLHNRAASIADRLVAQLRNHGVGVESAILHWHNHSLGKNSAAPAVIGKLAADGWRMLLQIHDFAEDNRPGNYQRLISASGARDKADLDRYLYPVAAQIHYATLTRADQSAVLQIGVPSDRTHWLPNSVSAPTENQPSKSESLSKVRQVMDLPSDARWYLYPVRGIRRKNVGEFLLLSRWTDKNCYAGLTLQPATPVEQRSYIRWRDLAESVALEAVFDAARPGVSFADNVSAAEAILSTSVAEGFGMTFLEPWLSGREVIARRLQTVTDDFEDSGIRIEKLYNQIPIPGDDQWLIECHTEYSAALEAAWEQIPARFRPRAAEINARPTAIDFAMLTTDRQVEVLKRTAEDSGFEAELKGLSAALVDNLQSDADPAAIDSNQTIIRAQYSDARAAERLMKIYRMIESESIDEQVSGPAAAGAAMDTINAVRPFYPCRTEQI